MPARIRQNSRIPRNRFRKVNSRLDAGHTLRLLIVFVRRGDELYFRERCVNILGPKLQRFLSAIIITTVVCRVKSNRYEQITAALERGDGRSELKSSWRVVKIFGRYYFSCWYETVLQHAQIFIMSKKAKNTKIINNDCIYIYF